MTCICSAYTVALRDAEENATELAVLHLGLESGVHKAKDSRHPGNYSNGEANGD